ncbi:hypothetical protein [Paenibacillus silvae]|nr:hypothetical protein [Paenibacillus silvae]
MNLNEKGNFRRQEWLYLLLLVILAFYPLLKIGLIINDDLKNALNAYNEDFLTYMRNFYEAWKFQGRTNFLASFFYYIPFMFDNFIYFKIITLSSLLLNISLMSIFVAKLFKNNIFAYIAFMFMIVSLQNSWEHNPITSFPGFFTFPFAFLLLSFLLFMKWLETSSKKHLIFTMVSYAVVLFSYELFVLYSPVFVLLTLIFTQNKKIVIKKLVPIGLLVLVYLIFYLLFRMINGGYYQGAQLDNDINIMNIIRVLWQFSISSIPSYYLFEHKYQYLLAIYNDTVYPIGSFKYVMNIIEAQWIVKAIIAVSLYLYVIKNNNISISLRKSIIIVLVSLCYFFIPNLLLAVTPLYQEAVVVNGQLGMPASYFSYFALMLSIVAVMVFVQKWATSKWSKRIIHIFFCMLIVFFSVSTDITNKYISKYQTMSTYKWNAVDELINTEFLKNIPENSVLYAPTLWDYIGSVGIHDSYWTDYFTYKLNKKITVVKELSPEIDLEQVYYLKYKQSAKEPNQYMIFSKITEIDSKNNTLLTNNVNIFNFSKYDEYLLIANMKKDKSALDSSVTLMGTDTIKTQNENVRLHVTYNMFQILNDLKWSNVESNDGSIDLDSIVVVY